MNVRCTKCGISFDYYSKHNVYNLNCRHHSEIHNGRCLRCGAHSNSMHNCYHTWKSPVETYFEYIIDSGVYTYSCICSFFRKLMCSRL